MQIPRKLKYAAAATIGAAVISGTALVSYLGFHGQDFYSYNCKDIKNGTYVTKTTIHWDLFSGEGRYSEAFVDKGNDKKIDRFWDSRDQDDLKEVLFKSPEDGYVALVRRGEYLWRYSINPTRGSKIDFGKREDLDIDSIGEGIIGLGMTEEEERYFNERYLEVGEKMGIVFANTVSC